MSKTPRHLAFAALLLLAASPAWAQEASPATGISAPPGGAGAATTAAPPPPKHSSFELLAAGDRKIARALFLAQHPTTEGPAPLSLNQIADLKVRDSWARVFKRMQSRGLLRAENLGQVVSAYERQLRSDTEPRHVARAGTRQSDHSATLVTNGQGDVIASSRRAGAGMEHGGDALGETGRSADMAAVPSDSQR